MPALALYQITLHRVASHIPVFCELTAQTFPHRRIPQALTQIIRANNPRRAVEARGSSPPRLVTGHAQRNQSTQQKGGNDKDAHSELLRCPDYSSEIQRCDEPSQPRKGAGPFCCNGGRL